MQNEYQQRIAKSNSLNLFKGCNIIEKLKKMLPFDVLQIFFSNEDGFKFLNIALPDTNLKTIEEKTKIISKLLDEIDSQEQNYYLNVYSKGTEYKFDLSEINNYIDEYVQIKTKKHYLEKDLWEGYLLKNDEENNLVILSINNKGRIQKLKIEKEQIKEIKLTAKITKEK